MIQLQVTSDNDKVIRKGKPSREEVKCDYRVPLASTCMSPLGNCGRSLGTGRAWELAGPPGPGAAFPPF